MNRRWCLAFALAGALGGCAPFEAVDGGGGRRATASNETIETPPDTPAPRPESCDVQDTKLQALVTAMRESPNALVVVKNPSCGTTTYLAGGATTADEGSLWRVTGITETYVAATVLSLAAEGKLSLEDPLSKFVPNLPKTGGITVRMLLNHTSGIYSYRDDPAYKAARGVQWSPHTLVQLATAHSPRFSPGKSFGVSETNYVLLGIIAEQVSGKRIGELVRARAFAPAGLKATFFDGEEVVAGRRARAFDDDDDDVTDKEHPSGVWAAGAIVATGADMCAWAEKLWGTTAVLAAPTQGQLTLSPVSTGRGTTWGLGVEIGSDAAGTSLSHTGEGPGVATKVAYWPGRRTAIFAAVNQEDVRVEPLFDAARAALFAQ
ncbi:MAG: beta-lactamase family protein [Myxococcales bacterium]|jgi:D-alanyl-D-alanine carboxypeptidase|nr:beta-lactamase family protein [Myxococcales bacterium]